MDAVKGDARSKVEGKCPSRSDNIFSLTHSRAFCSAHSTACQHAFHLLSDLQVMLLKLLRDCDCFTPQHPVAIILTGKIYYFANNYDHSTATVALLSA